MHCLQMKTKLSTSKQSSRWNRKRKVVMKETLKKTVRFKPFRHMLAGDIIVQTARSNLPGHIMVEIIVYGQVQLAKTHINKAIEGQVESKKEATTKNCQDASNATALGISNNIAERTVIIQGRRTIHKWWLMYRQWKNPRKTIPLVQK